MSDPFAQATADILSDPSLGVPAVYHGESGAVECTAVLDYNLEISDGYGTIAEVQIAVSVLVSEVGIPETGRSIDIDGTMYRIGAIVRRDDHLVTVSCS